MIGNLLTVGGGPRFAVWLIRQEEVIGIHTYKTSPWMLGRLCGTGPPVEVSSRLTFLIQFTMHTLIMNSVIVDVMEDTRLTGHRTGDDLQSAHCRGRPRPLSRISEFWRFLPPVPLALTTYNECSIIWEVLWRIQWFLSLRDSHQEADVS